MHRGSHQLSPWSPGGCSNNCLTSSLLLNRKLYIPLEWVERVSHSFVNISVGNFIGVARSVSRFVCLFVNIYQLVKDRIQNHFSGTYSLQINSISNIHGMRQSSNTRGENMLWRITKLIEFDVVFDWHAAIDSFMKIVRRVRMSGGMQPSSPFKLNKQIFQLIKTHYGPNATKSTNAESGGRAVKWHKCTYARAEYLLLLFTSHKSSAAALMNYNNT